MSKFNELFEYYRLKAGFSTLGLFGQALAEEGYVYEDSIFSKWKSGDRMPRDRELVLALIKTFVKKGGIKSVEEANNFLTSLDFRSLDIYEMRIFGEKNSEGIYSNYNPLVEPNMLFQQVGVNELNTRFVHLQSLNNSEEKAYWNYQIRCGIADYYSKLSRDEMSASEVFEIFSEDRYDRAEVVETMIAITTDELTKREYLTGLLRLCQGSRRLTPPLEVFEYYGSKGKLFHEELGLGAEEIADVNRLIIPHWAYLAGPFLLRQLQNRLEQLAEERKIRLLYVTLSSVIIQFVESVGISLQKVDNAFLFHRQPHAELIYPEAYTMAKKFSLYWFDMNPALFVFKDYGIMKQIKI